MIRKLKGGCKKEDIIMCKLKRRMDKGGHYDVEMTGCMQKVGIIMCKLKAQMDNESHYYVEMKWRMEKVALWFAN